LQVIVTDKPYPPAVAEPERPLAVLGATGFTGQLVCEAARKLGIPLRLVGRRRRALEKIAREGEEIRVANAKDEAALGRAFEGAYAVASLAGPFLPVGTGPVAAAIAAGAHYLDTSGEQAFARLVFDRFGPGSELGGVVILTSFGFDYVPGDLGARLAAEGIEPLDEIVTAYSVSGVSSSRGTRKSVGHIMGQPLVAWSEGRLVPSRFAETTRRIHFPFGDEDVVEWGGTEPLTVPRHTQVREVRSYVRGPKVASKAGGVVRFLGPLVRLAGRMGPRGPSEEKRKQAKFAVVVEARGSSGARRATITGSDVYGLTALLIAHGADLLRKGEARGAGVLAPAEAFDVYALLERLSPVLVLESLERL
jgi:short subunit dehydrogenase-like uncharacterized protein